MCDPFTIPAISSPVSDRKSSKFCPEIKGSVLISACNCNKRNGLQMECRRSDCQGKTHRRSNRDMNQINHTHHSDMSPVCPEIMSNDPNNENCLQVSDDMPVESALKPEEMSDIVYVDYGHNNFPDGNMQNMMNPMHAQMNQEAFQKMSSQQMMSQYQPQMMQSQGNHSTGDQKEQKMSSPSMMAGNQGYYPQVTMPQNMSSIPHVQMGDGKSIEVMSSMPQGQNFSMPGYNMMSSMPQNFNYYPMMQGQAPMMQAPMMAPMQAMNMQNYSQMQNPGQN